MYELYPYVTNDLSVGLFSPSDDDVYHSATGAATEAYTKFIFPAMIENFLCNHDSIRVLDICYGIGYNTESFLNFIFQIKFKNFLKSNNLHDKTLSTYNYKICGDNTFSLCNDKIYYDNTKNIRQKNLNYSDMIYNDNNVCKFYINQHEGLYNKIFNKNFSIYIKAIDSNKFLAFLSPFIKSKIIKFPKNQFKNEKIEKILKNSKNISNFNIPSNLIEYPPALSIFLLNCIIEQYPDMLYDNDFISILSQYEYEGYFSKDICRIFEFLKLKDNKFTLGNCFKVFLHNIYYRNISRRYKNDLKALKTLGIDFSLKISDARQELQSDDSQYDFIFLDAFTPTKCPCLWTLDFFKLLYSHLSDNGMILTYSNSAIVRNTFLSAGFFVGKIYNSVENRYTGTVAVKNNDLIKYELSEFDLGLLKTKAGIFYRDENLTDHNEAIIERHKSDVENSNLMSASAYKKQFNELNKLHNYN